MRRRGSIALAAGFAVIWLAGLAAYPLLESTEGRYASIARGMAHGESWIEPTFNGDLLFSKPPLAYWAGAVSLRLLPDSEWAVRLPAALMWLACGLLTVRLGILAGLDRRRAAWAGALAGLSPLAFVQGHMTTGDIFLWAGVLIAFQSLLDDRSQRWLRSALLGAGLAMGFLAKGHMVLFWVVLPSLAAAPLMPGGWRRLGRLVHPLTLLVFLGLGAPWFAAALHRHPDLLGYWLGSETADRFLTTAHGRSGPWWFFLPQVPLLMLPWLAELGRGARGRTTSVAQRRLWLLWVLVPLVIFSFSGSKRMNYLLPAITPLALITASGIAAQGGRSLRRRTVGWAALLLASPFVLGVTGAAPPTRHLVAVARGTGRPLAVYGTAPSAVSFYAGGRVPVFRGSGEESKAELREHCRANGVVLLEKRYLKDLARCLGREPRVLDAGGRSVLAGEPQEPGSPASSSVPSSVPSSSGR